jgi:hypothetical protein
VDSIYLQGRLITNADLDGIRQLRREHPEWSRRELSDHLVAAWRWVNSAGRPKDMAARSLLLKLQARGLIDLPTPRNGNGNRQRAAQAPGPIQSELLAWPPEPIEGTLAALQPLRLEWVIELAQRRRVASRLRQYHYQGFAGAVGENVQYLAQDVHGRELAVMVFGAAAWQVACRDQFIGWTPAQRQRGLPQIANQQRFLILPWVRVPHLASHLLGLSVRRLSADWQRRYGHAVGLVETFVDDARFTGAAYQAAGWHRLGQTTGRTRQDRDHTLRVPRKSVWVKPLHPRFREHLGYL